VTRLRRHWPHVAAAVILVCGAVLRLSRIDQVQFLLDSAGYYMISQNAVMHGALPAAGVSSSVATLTQPAAIFFYLPFVLLGDPVFGMYATVLTNLGALALAYLVAYRYFGAVPALVATLLFAVGTNPVVYSRGIWQCNPLPLFVVWLVALVFAGVERGRTGWIAWALPVWGFAVQLHPTTAPLLALLAVGWVLAPRTVRARDVLVGGLALLAVSLPAILWECASGYGTIRGLYAYSQRPATVDLDVLRQLIRLLGVPFAKPKGAIVPAAAAIGAILPLAGMTYLLFRVGRETAQGLRLAGASGLLDWARDPARSVWRKELLLVLWPLGVILPQIRHHSPIQTLYLIAVLPAPYIAAGILFGALLRRLEGPTVTWMRRAALGTAATLLVTGVCIHVYATVLLRRFRPPFSLGAERAGLLAAASAARTTGASLAVIQADYFTIDSVSYMLRNGFDLGLTTQIARTPTHSGPVRCLTAPADGPGVYLITGWGGEARPPVEEYVAGLGSGDFLAAMRSARYFRGYVFSLEPEPGEPLDVEFGGQLTLRRVWATRLRNGQRWLLMGFELAHPPPHEDEAHYRIVAQVRDSDGRPVSEEAAHCYGTPWVPGQRLLAFWPLAGDSPAESSVQVEVQSGHPAPYPTRLGPVRLESVFGAPSGAYLRGVEESPLPVTRCGGQGARCAEQKAVVNVE
jgi:hypothetical protein